MKLKIDLQIATECEHLPTLSQMQQWLEHALNYLLKNEPEAAVKLKSTITITIRIVDRDESAELNQNYRNKMGPTNILSFPEVSFPGIVTHELGSLVVCADLVEQEALQQQISINHHWAHLLAHGTLHLLGYDHIKDDEAELMEALEIKILAGLDIPNPYETQ
jgi:probable rRNA maturation factor